MPEPHGEEKQDENLSPEDRKVKEGLIKHLEGLAEEVKLTPEQVEKMRNTPNRHPLQLPSSQSARERIEERRETDKGRER
jgi:hypothetical protein